MKTIDKKEAVRAFADGKRVEVMGYSGVWAEVKHYSCFDADTGFRIAATDNDAEWLRREAEISVRSGVAHRNCAIAARLEADKARIAELELDNMAKDVLIKRDAERIVWFEHELAKCQAKGGAK